MQAPGARLAKRALATITRCGQIDEWIKSAPDNVHFLIDKAYYEFAEDADGYWSALKWVKTNPADSVARLFCPST